MDRVFWASDLGDDWEEVLAELTRAFEMSRAAALEESSFVFVVHNDDLLGRRGPGKAMVASALLSAARTAALEGRSRGWTANVVAYDADTDPSVVQRWAEHLLESEVVTGELTHVGPGHLGKALP